MNVKGLKITDILDIDLDTFNHLSQSQLRALTSRLVSASNKRIRRLEKKDINSPAIRGLGDMEKFSTKLPTDLSNRQKVNRLRNVFARARLFLTAETSTISGYKEYVKRTKERIAKELNISVKTLNEKVDVKRLFDMLHTAQSKGLVSSYRGSEASQQGRDFISDILINNPNIDQDSLMDDLDAQMKEWYENKEKEETQKLEDETTETTI